MFEYYSLYVSSSYWDVRFLRKEIGILLIFEPVTVPLLLCLAQCLAPNRCSVNIYSTVQILEIHEVYYLTNEYSFKGNFYYLEIHVDFGFRDFTVLINLSQNTFEAKRGIWVINWFYLCYLFQIYDFYISLPGKLLYKLWYTHNMKYYTAIKSGRYAYADILYCWVKKANLKSIYIVWVL